MSRVGIDLDGVCYDFAASVREYLMQAGMRFEFECPDPTRWEFYEDWGLSLDLFLTSCHRGVEAGVIFQRGNPHEGTRDALIAIKDAGHSLHIVTDRSFGRNGASAQATVSWLTRHDLPYDSITFSADKTVVRLDAMIEDKLSNYDALTASGVKAYLLNRPWNRAVGDTRRRVGTIAEFAEAVS